MAQKNLSISDCSPLGRIGRDLSNRKLSNEQKTWICEVINAGLCSTTFIEGSWNLNRKTINKWLHQYNDGKAFREDSGRPSLLSDKHLNTIREQMLDDTYKHSMENFRAIVTTEIKKSLEENNKPLSCFRELSKRTLQRYEKILKVVTAKGKRTTDARVKAVADIRNAVSFGIMNSIIVPNVHQALILNSDATQYAVNIDSDENVVVKYIKREDDSKLERGDKRPNKVLPAEESTNLMQYFIKYYLLMSAIGTVSYPVFMIADDTLPESTFVVQEFPCLGYGVSIHDKGYLVICKTRAGNISFYKWFNLNVTIPFANALRSSYGLDPHSPAWYQLDGENVQIKCYEDGEILKELETNNIIIGKPSGSTTEITQPCDRGNAFKASKKVIRSVHNDQIECYDTKIQILTEFLKNNSQLDARKRKMAVYGLLRVQLALQITMRPRIVTDSFKWTGIYPFNMQKILKNCSTILSGTEEKLIMDAIPTLSEKFQNQGELFDEDFDEVGIKETTKKDHLVTNRRRSIILTSKGYICRQMTKKLNDMVKEVNKVKRTYKRKINMVSHNSNIESLILKIPKLSK
jgi:transposase